MTTELPPGWKARPGRSRTGRDYMVVTAPDGRRATFYDEGDMRLHKPDHTAALRDPSERPDGTSVYIDFTPKA